MTLKEKLSKNQTGTWVLFCTFALLTLAKTLLFNHFAFQYHQVPSLWSDFATCMGLLLPKISVAILISALLFVLRDKRWMILVSVIVDTWIVANLIYMRNNYILLDAEAFNSSGNLHGYWMSTFIYIEWGIDLLFYLLTALWSLLLKLVPVKQKRAWTLGLYMVIAGLFIHLLGDSINGAHGGAIRRDGREKVYGTNFSTTVGRTSVLESPIYIVSDYQQMIKNDMPDRPLTDEDMDIMSELANGDPDYKVDSPLIIILLESLENWVVREDVMPNLWRLTQAEHVLYANRIHTQIVGAPSADGQMIVNTGLLPITAGGTCLHYPTNEFPALMKLTDEHTVCLLPHDTCVWNQTQMSPAYGYDTTIIFSDIDTLLFKELNRLIDNGERHIQCITQSTHAPFINCKYSKLQMPKDMPWVMSNYIRGFNALDDGLAQFVHKLETDPVLQTYTIVITGDHRILHREKRQQMMRYCQKHGYNYDAREDVLPLIIYSPKIQGNRRVEADTYQMDIYPTVLHLIGAEGYMWQGFGVNLMDEQAIENRTLSPKKAADISDRVIRNNYFNWKEF